jgi:N-acetylglucosamine-6-phosphate deacetylase
MTIGNQKNLLLVRARLVLPDHVLEQGSLLVADGHIAGIFTGEPTSVARGAAEYDLGGATLFPGFIDAHIHGAVGVDAMEAEPEDLLRVSRFLATQGVTGWLPTLVPGPSEQYESAIKSISSLMKKQSASSGARALGVHYEGPFMNSEQCGALHREYFRTFSNRADLDSLATLSDTGAVHMMTLAPEIDGGVALVRELNARGWIISIGHTHADLDVLDRAFEAGARHMTHFMNAMTPFHHRAPGPIGWGLLRDDVTCDLIADGIHLDQVTLRLLQKLKGAARLSLISDAVAAAGLGDGDYQIWGETISVVDGRTRNPRGSIAGSVITMLDAVRLMQKLGASEVDVAQMASTNPARLLGIEAECGSIAEGKRADLVGLDQEGKVRFTMVGGEVLGG